MLVSLWAARQGNGKTWAGSMQQEGEQLAEQKPLNYENDIPVTHRTCQITSTRGLKSLLSCPKWISDGITWPFKRVICVRAPCKGSSTGDSTLVIYRLQMQWQQSCSWDAIWALVWDPYSLIRAIPAWGGIQVQHGAGALQIDQGKIRVCGSQHIELQL